MTDPVPFPRTAARVLLLDGGDRVLLFRGGDPHLPEQTAKSRLRRAFRRDVDEIERPSSQRRDGDRRGEPAIERQHRPCGKAGKRELHLGAVEHDQLLAAVSATGGVEQGHPQRDHHRLLGRLPRGVGHSLGQG